jgi:HAD superfamily hydrolase (TIGR01450 family)
VIDSLPVTRIRHLLGAYDTILIDAYGVLVTHDAPLPGAGPLVDHLNATGKPYFILTNDASRSPERSSARFAERGLSIAPERILTSGGMIASHFAEHGLAGARTAVLGTEDSARFVKEAGATLVELEDSLDIEVLVVCDERDYPLPERLDLALSALFRAAEAGRPLHLVLANPDLIYPAGPGRFGFTGGAMAALLEIAYRFRFPEHSTAAFIPLGKPHPPMFLEARRRAGPGPMVMLGDQLGTDILGAANAGIDSALVLTGVFRAEHLQASPVRPTYLLRTLDLD